MSLSFLERISSNYLQINLHDFESNEASLRFIRQRDSLLSVDFLFSNNKVNIAVSSHLAEQRGHHKMIDSLSNVNIDTLQLRYNPNRNIITLSIIQQNTSGNESASLNEIWTRKCRIHDFDYEWIALINLKASLQDLDSVDNQNTQTIVNFTKETLKLPQFETFRKLLELGEVDSDQLVSCFNETINEQQVEYQTHQKYARMELNKMEQDFKSPKREVLKTKQVSRTMSKPVILKSQTNKDNSIQLTPDGYFQTLGSDNSTTGTWNAITNRLLLFPSRLCDARVLLLHGNRFYENASEQYWAVETEQIDGNGILSTRNLSESLIVMVITCRRRLHLVKQINNSWGGELRKLGIKVWFVIGGCKTSELDGNFIKLCCPDNYESLPQKIYRASQFILRNFSFQHLYKVDDDTLVNPRLLLSIPLDKYHYLGRCETVTHEFNRYWHRGKCENKSLDHIPYPISRIRYGATYAKGEAGYFLSRKAVQMLNQFEDSICSDLYEDKAIGDALGRASLEVSEDTRYQSKLYENFRSDVNLDRFCVIVDIGSNMCEVYHKFLKYHVTL